MRWRCKKPKKNRFLKFQKKIYSIYTLLKHSREYSLQPVYSFFVMAQVSYSCNTTVKLIRVYFTYRIHNKLVALKCVQDWAKFLSCYCLSKIHVVTLLISYLCIYTEMFCEHVIVILVNLELKIFRYKDSRKCFIEFFAMFPKNLKIFW